MAMPPATITVDRDTVSGSGLKRKANDIESNEPPVESPRKIQVITLQPDSDITLVFSKRTVMINHDLHLKVSGSLLGLASKVFKTMLSSNFIEADSKIINLKDDDPQTYLDFCHIIHHQYDCIKGMDATRMGELIVLADMRDAREALRPWIVSELVDHLAWLKSDLTSIFVEPMESNTLLAIEDFIPFAASFGLDDLFHRATLAYLTRGDKNITDGYSYEKPGLKTGPIDSNGVSLYDFLNVKRLNATRGLLQDAMKAIGTGFTTNSRGQSHTAATMCKISQSKYGTFMSWLAMEGISAGEIQSYQGSWLMAMKSINRIANKKSGSADPDGGAEGENWHKQCKSASCTYCETDIKARLKELKTKKTRETAGVCFRCFLENGPDDCLRRTYCKTSGHSDGGRRIQYKTSE